jgi:hypothetical protein
MPFVPLMERPATRRRLAAFGSRSRFYGRPGWWLVVYAVVWIGCGSILVATGQRWLGVLWVLTGVAVVSLGARQRRRDRAFNATWPASAVFCGLAGLRVPWRRFARTTVSGVLMVLPTEIRWVPHDKQKFAERQEFEWPWAMITLSDDGPTIGGETTFTLITESGEKRTLVTRDGPEVRRAIDEVTARA